MNQKTIEAAEKALMDFIRKNQRDYKYFKGRLSQADNLPAPNQHMVSAAVRKVDWYKVQLSELEGELEMLREELGLAENTPQADTDQKEEQGGEEEKNTEHDQG
jgi:hypothetical protein